VDLLVYVCNNSLRCRVILGTFFRGKNNTFHEAEVQYTCKSVCEDLYLRDMKSLGCKNCEVR
jgi:hypothetical protein